MQRERARVADQLAAIDQELAYMAEVRRKMDAATAGEHRVLDLHTRAEESNIKHMNSPATSTSPKKIGRPILSTHPFAKRCVELHGSVKVAAKALGVSPSTARSWYADDESARPIPEAMADKLSKKPWSITRHAWHNGIA